MNREEIIAIFKVLKTAYPKFYAEMSRKEAEDTINLWQEMFAHENPALVTAAIKDLINSFKFPPTIADVKDRMYELTNTETETPIEIWNEIMSAIRNSIYYAGQEFERLPDMAKKFVGSPAQLREWAMSEDFNESVVRGQFLKQIEVIKKRDKDNAMMLPDTKAIIGTLANKFMLED